MSTVVLKNGREIPFEEWEDTERRKIKLQLALARTAEELKAVEKRAAHFNSVRQLMKPRGRVEYCAFTGNGRERKLNA